jgi:hypothetical protein
MRRPASSGASVPAQNTIVTWAAAGKAVPRPREYFCTTATGSAARRVVLAAPPSDDPECGPVARSRAGADVRPRMVCTRCGIVGADARPNWQEQPPRESLTGVQWR